MTVTLSVATSLHVHPHQNNIGVEEEEIEAQKPFSWSQILDNSKKQIGIVPFSSLNFL